ncbi:MAG TPA: DUF2062 domain-containing protein, partial [Sphingomonas sp.]|nr:DUF2062 domain-containing protein [Sphingomonas sp.]
MAEPATPVSATGRVIGWVKHHVPTRESIEANRWLRPVAHRILVPHLWRFNRRSVPRGVALGLFSGVLFPFAHMGIAAVLALPFRANVPTAVGTTLLNNPITFLPLMASAYQIGHWVLRLDHAVPGRPLATNVKANEGVLHWLVAQGGPATIVGLVILASVLAIIGYFATGLIWRLKIARKWRRRHLKTGN